MSRVGLFFGSFNPIHLGHLKVAESLQLQKQLDEVWFVVSPQNPFKQDANLAPEDLRLLWVQKAIRPIKSWKISDIEFSMERPSYTILTVLKLKEKFPLHDFFLMMGADNLAGFHLWKEHEKLAQICPLLIYARMGFPEPDALPSGAHFFHLPLLDISATEIREALKYEKSIENWIPQEIISEVKFYFGTDLMGS